MVVTRTITATAVGSSPATTTGTVTVTVPGPGGDFTTTVVTGEQQTVTTTVTLPSATTTQTIQQVIITSTVTTVPVTVTVAGFTTTTHYFPACATIDNQIAVLSGGRAINGFQESGIPDLQTVDLSFTSASESPYECCASCWRDDGTDYDGVGPDKTCWGSLWREGTCMVLRGPGLCLQPRHGAYFVSGLHNVLSMVASNGKCGYLYDDAFLTITPELVGDTAAGSIGDAEDA